MTSLRTLLILLALAAYPLKGAAHEGDDHAASAIDARTVADLNELTARKPMPGTVAELKAGLYRVETWPGLFSDVRSATKNPDGTWSIDFQRFGHAHDFHVTRTRGGVVLRIAAQDHGQAVFEYALEPIDAAHSLLTVRFAVTTPPNFTADQMLALLRAKAAADLNDFSNHAHEQNTEVVP